MNRRSPAKPIEPNSEKLVAIAPFLRFCPQVMTLGVKASMGDYTPAERRLLLSAGRILFPTPRFAGILEAAGKETFPSDFTYTVQKSRLIQETLFQFLNCPHPYTRIYYGHQKRSIPESFSFPFRAMGPKLRDSVLTVSNMSDLRIVSEIYNPLLVQEILNYQELFRLVFIGYQCVGIIKRGSRETIGRAGRPMAAGSGRDIGVSPECFSREIVSRLEKLLEAARINMIAAEVGLISGDWRLIELNRPPVFWPTLEGEVFKSGVIARMIESKRF